MTNSYTFDPKTSKNIKSKSPYIHGWISKSGEFYSHAECDEKELVKVIARENLNLTKSTDLAKSILRKDWVKVFDMSRMLIEPIPRITIENNRPLTQSQKDTLNKYVKHFNLSQKNFWGYEL